MLLTDGVLDTNDGLYTDYRNLYNAIVQEDLETGIRTILDHLSRQGARDSATIVCWKYSNKETALTPSD